MNSGGNFSDEVHDITGADTTSHRRFARGFLLDAESIAWFFDQYIARADRRDWRLAPLEADDLYGVAPAFVLLAEHDPLVDEGLAYADRLRAAGVPVELHIHPGAPHGFERFVPDAGVAQRAMADRTRAVAAT